MKRNKKMIFITILIASIIILSYSAYKLKYIDILLGIIKLERKKTKIVSISLKSFSFVTKTISSDQIFMDNMKSFGWTYYDKYGRGYLFVKEGEEILATRTNILSKYVIYEIHNKDFFDMMNKDSLEY
jgi:hypothetical protein